MHIRRVVRIRRSRPKSPGLHLRRWFTLTLVVMGLLNSPEGFCSRLPGMGLREGVTDWRAYVLESTGAVTKFNRELEVVESHEPLESRGSRHSILSAAMSSDERWLLIGGYEWQTGYLSAISTSDLEYLQGPLDWYVESLLPDTGLPDAQYPLAKLPEYDTIRPSHEVSLIAPISERFVYVRNDRYKKHPSGVFLRIDTHHCAANFLPNTIDTYLGPESFRISPDRKQFVALGRDNVARLFRTYDGRLLKESVLPRFRTAVFPDDSYPDGVHVYGYDVDWETEQLDIWWTRLTAERPLQRVRVTLGENEVRVQEASNSPWPDTALCMHPEALPDASHRKAYQLYFTYLRFAGALGYISPCLTAQEARLFSEVMKEPGRFSSMPDEILATFLSPDGRYFFCQVVRPVEENESPYDFYGFCAIDVETGKVVQTRAQTSQVVGIYFDSEGSKALP